MSKFINYLRPLIEDSTGKISMGRVAFWIAFGLAMRTMYLTGTISGEVIGLITCLLAYSMGKLFVGTKYNVKQNGDISKEENDDFVRPDQGIKE